MNVLWVIKSLFVCLLFMFLRQDYAWSQGKESSKQSNQSLFNSNQALGSQSREVIQKPGEKAFIGNVFGSLLGGLMGAGLTTITGVASGGLDDVDRTLYGLYLGGIIGSGAGSSIVLYDKETKGFAKILIRAFIPHLIFSGGGLILSRVTETPSDGVILAGGYLLGWLISPIEAARAYKSYNRSEASVGGLNQNFKSLNENLASVRIELVTLRW